MPDPFDQTPRLPPQQVGRLEPLPQTPVGCICPAGANKDCERPDCPRKGLSSGKAFGPATLGGELLMKGGR